MTRARITAVVGYEPSPLHITTREPRPAAEILDIEYAVALGGEEDTVAFSAPVIYREGESRRKPGAATFKGGLTGPASMRATVSSSR